MNRDQLVAGGVAAAAFACSATHIYTVAKASGNAAIIAAVHPIGLDGLIYIGMRAVSSGRRWQGWLATTYGVAMSLTFNAVSYAHVSMPAAVMAVAMPLALVLGVLVVGHGQPVQVDTPVDTPAPAATAVPATVPSRPAAVAVPVAATVPPKAITPAPRKVISTPVAAAALAMALRLVDEGMTTGEADAKTAAEYGLSTRTLRRYRERAEA